MFQEKLRSTVVDVDRQYRYDMIDPKYIPISDMELSCTKGGSF
jgi:hypothetical protein